MILNGFKVVEIVEILSVEFMSKNELFNLIFDLFWKISESTILVLNWFVNFLIKLVVVSFIVVIGIVVIFGVVDVVVYVVKIFVVIGIVVFKFVVSFVIEIVVVFKFVVSVVIGVVVFNIYVFIIGVVVCVVSWFKIDVSVGLIKTLAVNSCTKLSLTDVFECSFFVLLLITSPFGT